MKESDQTVKESSNALEHNLYLHRSSITEEDSKSIISNNEEVHNRIVKKNKKGKISYISNNAQIKDKSDRPFLQKNNEFKKKEEEDVINTSKKRPKIQINIINNHPEKLCLKEDNLYTVMGEINKANTKVGEKSIGPKRIHINSSISDSNSDLTLKSHAQFNSENQYLNETTNNINNNNNKNENHYNNNEDNINNNKDNINNIKNNNKEEDMITTAGNNNDSEIKENKENINQIYDLITNYHLHEEITDEQLKSFFFWKIPNTKTLMTNINIIKLKKKSLLSKLNIFSYFFNSNSNNDNNKVDDNSHNNSQNELKINRYDFELEILKNQKVYYYAKIIQLMPYVKVKIYMSVNAQYEIQNYKDEKRLKNEEQKQNEFKNILNKCKFIEIAKIESNVIRNKFVLCEGGNKDEYNYKYLVIYDFNPFGMYGIRNMKVYQNSYSKSNMKQIDYYNPINYDMIYENAEPIWDEFYKTYKLNFNQRVKIANKKNFILQKIIKENDENILQCGEINDNCYALDFINPCSPFLAFCLGISSIINKSFAE